MGEEAGSVTIMEAAFGSIMNQDQFLLKWNNHQNNFVEVFSYLRTQDAFVDVTLACDGKSFSAHRVVLSACSPYFQTLFQTNPCKHPIVFLKDVKGQELEALLEFIYKGEVSVSQSELASLISTAENLKIKGLAEPDRPTEKGVKRLSSPPRSQTLAAQTTPVTAVGVSQHLQVSKYPQSSPVTKRKKTEQFNVQSSYVGVRENQEETLTVEAGNGENLSLRGENLSLRGENLSLREHPAPQVVLVPSHDPPHQADVAPHASQPYASHHPITASEGVLYSVSGTAIYASTAQVTSSGRGEQIGREVYSQADQYHSGDEGTLPGPSGVQPQQTHPETSMTIKLEPASAGIPTETWEGSNQSYEDGTTLAAAGGATAVVATDPMTMQLPLHSDMSDSSQLHDSSRQLAAARALLRVLGAAGAEGRKAIRTDSTKHTVAPGQCRVCGETIARGEHRSHMASHTAHRPLHCAVCGRGFHQTEDLKRHIRIHTGEKPYKCSMCGVAFRQRGHLSRHIFKYHPEQRPPLSK